MDLPSGAPRSPLFEVRDTPHCGRAVFASQDIPIDTLIWSSDDLSVDVLLREYRREVCGECFGYEYGRDLSIRDKTVGFAFCNEGCRTKWKERNGEIGVQAWSAVEKLIKGRSNEDSEMVDAKPQRPRPKEINQAWEAITTQAELIRIARSGDRDTPAGNGAIQIEGGVKPTKQHRKALQKALMQPISPDTMTFVMSGILFKHNNPDKWDNIVALASDDTPHHNSDYLQAAVRTYLHLLAILPLPLLQHVTPQTIRLLFTRDSHNAFGIRSLEDDGSEHFGYGCWPAASYFNHSCAPTIEKSREGRVFNFRAARDIEKGEELSITYLSSEERKMSRGQRMMILKTNWGFECGCDRCETL